MREKLKQLRTLKALLTGAPKTAFTDEISDIMIRVQADIDAYDEMICHEDAQTEVSVAYGKQD